MPARRWLISLALSALALATVVQPHAPASAQEQINFIESSATSDFPRSIEFSMTAEPTAGVDSVQLFWRTVGSAAFTLSDPVVEAGELLEATFTADTSIRYLPPGIDIEYFWRVTNAAGAVHESPVETLFYMDQRFDWETIQAGLVSVWWQQGSLEFAEEIAHAANRTLVTLEADYGIAAGSPIRIVVYGSERDFSSALRPNSAEWIGGVAYSSLGHIVAHIRPGGNAHREINRMIPHEVSHVAVHQASLNPYNSPPPWLDEGLATFVQSVDDPRLRPTLDRAVREGRLIPIGALKSSFPLDADQALLSYAESVSIVSYLAETYGTETVGELVTIYTSDVSHDDAVQEVLGMSIDDLDRDWKAWLGYGGDRAPDGSGGATTLGIRVEAWYAMTLLAAGLITAGLILALFWRTRSYADTDLEDESADSSSTVG